MAIKCKRLVFDNNFLTSFGTKVRIPDTSKREGRIIFEEQIKIKLSILFYKNIYIHTQTILERIIFALLL
jgi:hypothetical protein